MHYRIDIDLTAVDDGAVVRSEAPDGEWTELHVRFSDDGQGLCGFDGDDGRFVHTRLKPASLSRLFPWIDACGDAPGTVDVRVVAPPSWTVVSNAPPSSVADGVWCFRPARPMKLESLAVCAGPWARVGDLYARPSLADELARTTIAADVAASLDHHARMLGVAYPYDQAAVVFVPGYASLGGFNPGGWLLHEDLLRERSRRRTLWAVAHETAHSWFAGVVDSHCYPTARWLTEGLSTYVCHRAMVEIAPELEAWATFHVLEELGAHEADLADDAHPVADMPEGGHPSLVYGKPAALLRQLPPSVVDAALHRYLHRHAFGTATTEDLLRCLSWAAGRDLDRWADDWLRTPGVDTIAVELGVDDGGVVTDARVRVDGHRTHDLLVRAFDGLVARDPIPVVASGPRTPLPQLVGRRRPDLVVPNAPARTYAVVELDESSWATLHRCLRDLDADTRSVCWVAAKHQLPADELTALVDRHAEVEPDPWVRSTIQSWR